jgi:hypothetical protein
MNTKGLIASLGAYVLICESRKDNKISWHLDASLSLNSEHYCSKDMILRRISISSWVKNALKDGKWVEISDIDVSEIESSGRRREFSVKFRGKEITPEICTEFEEETFFDKEADFVKTNRITKTFKTYKHLYKVFVSEKKTLIWQDDVREQHRIAVANLESKQKPIDGFTGWDKRIAPVIKESVEYGEKYLKLDEESGTVQLRQVGLNVTEYGEYSVYTVDCPREINGWHWQLTEHHWNPRVVKEEEKSLEKVLKSVPLSVLEKRVTVTEEYVPCRLQGGYYFNNIKLDGVKVARVSSGSYCPSNMQSSMRFDSDGDVYFERSNGLYKKPFSWSDFPVDVFEKTF